MAVPVASFPALLFDFGGADDGADFGGGARVGNGAAMGARAVDVVETFLIYCG